MPVNILPRVIDIGDPQIFGPGIFHDPGDGAAHRRVAFASDLGWMQTWVTSGAEFYGASPRTSRARRERRRWAWGE